MLRLYPQFLLHLVLRSTLVCPLIVCIACQSPPYQAPQATTSPSCQSSSGTTGFMAGTTDLPLYPCMLHANSITTGTGNAHILTFSTSDAPATILAYFRQRLADAGWVVDPHISPTTQSLNVNKPDHLRLPGLKDEYRRHVQVSVTMGVDEQVFVVVAESYEVAAIVDPTQTPNE